MLRRPRPRGQPPLSALRTASSHRDLRCGVFAFGFIRCHCDACGHDLLVAFACKGRGVCPSCAGGSLNLNVHYHVVFLDGVFTRDGRARPQFHSMPPPEPSDLGAIVQRVQKRAVAWLRRRGYLEAQVAEERSPDLDAQGAIEACAAIAMQRGTFAALPNTEPPGASADAPRSHAGGDHEGGNLHAGVHIAPGDDLGRERLLRYGPEDLRVARATRPRIATRAGRAAPEITTDLPRDPVARGMWRERLPLRP